MDINEFFNLIIAISIFISVIALVKGKLKINKLKIKNRKQALILLLVVLFILPSITGFLVNSIESVDKKIRNDEINNEKKVNETKTTEIKSDKSDMESLKESLKDELGNSNLHDHKNRLIDLGLFESETSKDSLGIDFLMNDNLSENLIRGSAKTDIGRMMKIVIKNYEQIDKLKNIDYILVRGLFPLNDKYGNEKLETMILAYFKVSELEKVNWDKDFSYDLTQVAEYYKFEK